MTYPGLSHPAQPALDPPRTWSAPRTQQSFDKSAQVRPCSSQVLDAEEVTLPPVLEELTDDVFAPQPGPRPNVTTSTSATAPSLASATTPSTTDMPPETDSGAEDRQGTKWSVSTSDTSYSQPHRTLVRGPSNYPKRPSQPHPLAVSQAEDSKGQKRAVASSYTSYSQEHRTTNAGPSNYPKRPNRPRAVISSEEDEQLPRPRRPRSPDSD